MNRMTSRRHFLFKSVGGYLAANFFTCPTRAEASNATAITLPVRWQAKAPDGSFSDRQEIRYLVPSETAFVICDMWDRHWCHGATRRCDALARTMAPVVDRARSAGIHILHAPSSTLDFYKQHPARRRAIELSLVESSQKIHAWCHLDPDHEGELPIDDTDGGCDCAVPCRQHAPWQRQHAAISIADSDFISDDGRQIYSYLKSREIQHILYLGVHTNMCVLGRSFGIRQMTRLGFNTFLVRDLTDSMYNPRMRPQVSHDQGTALVISHIERHWCPTTTSTDFVQGLPA